MRTIFIVGLAAGLAAIAPSASVARANPASAPNQRAVPQPGAGTPADSARQICLAEPRSESRIHRPVCHTAREWIAIEGEVPDGR